MNAPALKLLLLLLAILSSLSVSAESKEGGGGDAEEAKVNEIREDLLNWIKSGGHLELKYPADLTPAIYEEKMTRILAPKAVLVAFVENDNSSDPELRVSVEGVPKTCRGFISRKKKPSMVCNINRFRATPNAAQYRLIHHEYAGLVLAERNDGAASDYELSNQLTEYFQVTSNLTLKLSSTKGNILSEKTELKAAVYSAQCFVEVLSEVIIPRGEPFKQWIERKAYILIRDDKSTSSKRIKKDDILKVHDWDVMYDPFHLNEQTVIVHVRTKSKNNASLTFNMPKIELMPHQPTLLEFNTRFQDLFKIKCYENNVQDL